MREITIDGGTPKGGEAGTSPQLLFTQSQNTVLLDVANRSGSNWIYLSINKEGEPGTGMAVPPETARSWENVSGTVYICADAANTPYSAFAGLM